jgi:hypothetical protein
LEPQRKREEPDKIGNKPSLAPPRKEQNVTKEAGKVVMVRSAVTVGTTAAVAAGRYKVMPILVGFKSRFLLGKDFL